MPNQNHLYYLQKCNQIAKESVSKGNHPFGALIVFEEEIVCFSGNEVETKADVTAHAELLLVQKAQKLLTKNQIQDCTLYTSTEPCAMCSGAIYWAGINKVVYGCSTDDLNIIVGGSLRPKASEILNSGTREISVMDYSSKSEFRELHESFWPNFIP